ncbi:MAG: oxidoreductase, partial [Thiohalospira sp.]
IDSVLFPAAPRPAIWARLAELVPLARLEALTTTIGLDEVPEQAGRILQGAVRGRTVVRVSD